jgi:hypothetical protein
MNGMLILFSFFFFFFLFVDLRRNGLVGLGTLSASQPLGFAGAKITGHCPT